MSRQRTKQLNTPESAQLVSKLLTTPQSNMLNSTFKQSEFDKRRELARLIYQYQYEIQKNNQYYIKQRIQQIKNQDQSVIHMDYSKK
ncbi:hypothetical protein pb186bvf_006473 [Paramecium bursaria]